MIVHYTPLVIVGERDAPVCGAATDSSMTTTRAEVTCDACKAEMVSSRLSDGIRMVGKPAPSFHRYYRPR